ncbi:hypothetical protein ABVF61_01245 [Roseibium sp. HPY-6]|uniref:hypothetical protein n=1 Tax=Roseibium sp. HPY-6 TaxID=3229852 RepID=UPI00338DC533
MFAAPTKELSLSRDYRSREKAERGVLAWMRDIRRLEVIGRKVFLLTGAAHLRPRQRLTNSLINALCLRWVETRIWSNWASFQCSRFTVFNF